MARIRPPVPIRGGVRERSRIGRSWGLTPRKAGTGCAAVKLFSALLATIGIVLGVIAVRAEAPTYQAPDPTLEPERAPLELSGDVPEGCRVEHFDVEGMCCEGCAGKLYAAARLHKIH